MVSNSYLYFLHLCIVLVILDHVSHILKINRLQKIYELQKIYWKQAESCLIVIYDVDSVLLLRLFTDAIAFPKKKYILKKKITDAIAKSSLEYNADTTIAVTKQDMWTCLNHKISLSTQIKGNWSYRFFNLGDLDNDNKFILITQEIKLWSSKFNPCRISRNTHKELHISK